MEQKNALGRRKSAVARVYLAAGQGNITINGRTLEDYFKEESLRYIVNQPFQVTSTEGQFDTKVTLAAFRDEMIRLAAILPEYCYVPVEYESSPAHAPPE